MLIVIGIALTSAVLLLSVRVGTRSSLPVAVLSGLAAFFLLGPSFGLAPVMEAMIHLVLRVQPSVEFISLLLSFLLAFRLAFLLAPRFGLPFPEAPSMMLWRPWEELIWVTIGALALSLLGVIWLADLALNAVVVMSVIYAAQGLAVLRFFSRRHGVPRALELPFYIALLLLPGLALIGLAFAGLLDTWFDWRRLRPVPLEDETRDED